MSRIDAPRAASRRGRPSAVPTDAGRSVGRAATLVGLGVVVVGVLVALALMNPGPSLPTRLQDGLTLSISVLIESLPFVVLGVLLSIVVQVWVPPGAIERWMPRAAWARRAVLSLLGMLIPVCECGNVPFARGLMMRGFGVSETMTFLIAAPIVNPIVIITTHQAFGFDDGILIARLLGGYAVANLIGWLYSRHPDPDALLTDRFRDSCAVSLEAGHDRAGRGQRSLAQFVVELRAVMPALVIGSALAGAVQVLKHLVARARPEEIIVIADVGSYPSGHVANAATIALALVVLVPRWWAYLLAVAWVLAMAFTRTFLGAHFITDTVGGTLLGVGAGLLIAAWVRPRPLVPPCNHGVARGLGDAVNPSDR